MQGTLIDLQTSRERVVTAILDTFFPRCECPSPLSGTIQLQQFYTLQGSDLQGLVSKIVNVIDEILPPDQRRELFLLFRLLNSRLGTFLIAGRDSLTNYYIIPSAFPDLDLASRTRVLLAWSRSNTVKFRKAFIGLKGLFISTLFTFLLPDNTSPILDALSYDVVDPLRPPTPLSQAVDAENGILAALIDLSDCDGPSKSRAASKLTAKGLTLHWPGHKTSTSTSIPSAAAVVWSERPDFIIANVDAVVVGSGAGGGVTAARLAAKGLRVLVIEKSSFIPAQQLTLREGASFETMMERGGLLTTENGATSVLAGSTLGGGTRVNWNASFKTPAHVRQEWVDQGVRLFESDEYAAAVEVVCARLGVNTKFGHGGACSALAAGLSAAGMHCEEVPRNCVDPHCGGHCCFGCARGAKQDSVNTFLSDACSTPGSTTRVLTGAWVEKVLLQKSTTTNKKAVVGVLLKIEPHPQSHSARGAGGRPLTIAVSAPIVVACAGALHTPALLLRSGITCGGNVGKNLRLHPCTCVVGVFSSDAATAIPAFMGEAGVVGYTGPTAAGSIRCSEGPIMSIFSKEASAWESSGYGSILYTPAVHPGLFAAAAPFTGGHDFKDLIVQYPNAVAVLVLTRDSNDTGKVVIDSSGQPRLHYEIAPRDEESMVQGMQLGLKALKAAGATSVMTCLNSERGRFDVVNGGDDGDFEAWLGEVRATGVPLLKMATFSAHQMGTARLGVSPATSVCDAEMGGECWEAAGLFCCDASTFPTSLGINPMVTIEAIAYVLAGRIAERAVVERSSRGGGSGGRGRRGHVDDVEYETKRGSKL